MEGTNIWLDMQPSMGDDQEAPNLEGIIATTRWGSNMEISIDNKKGCYNERVAMRKKYRTVHESSTSAPT